MECFNQAENIPRQSVIDHSFVVIVSVTMIAFNETRVNNNGLMIRLDDRINGLIRFYEV